MNDHDTDDHARRTLEQKALRNVRTLLDKKPSADLGPRRALILFFGIFFGIGGAILAVTAVVIWINTAAKVRIDHLGRPGPEAVIADRGECGLLQRSEAEGGLLSHTECGVPYGVRRFTVKCRDWKRPDAVITWDIPFGSPQHLQFRDACSSAAVDVVRENGRRRTASTWDPR